MSGWTGPAERTRCASSTTTAPCLERLEVTHDAAAWPSCSGAFVALGATAGGYRATLGPAWSTRSSRPAFGRADPPNAVKATRPRYRSHGGKSDASDAYVLADLLRTDGHRFQPLAPQSDEIRALRALVRGRDDLVATRVQLANQLRSLLESFWPGAAAVFADIDSPIALAFIQRYPTPESASRLGPKR